MKLPKINKVQLSRIAISFIIFSVFAFHMVGTYRIELLERFDNILYDLRLRALLKPENDDRIVIIDIDEKSLANEGRWPWHRDKMSFLVDMLFDYYGVGMVAFDVTFPEPDDHSDSKILSELEKGDYATNQVLQEAVTSLKRDFAYDQNFANSLKDRNVVLGYFIGGSEDVNTGLLPAPLLYAKDVPFAEDIYEGKSYGSNLPILQQAVERGGYFNNPLVDGDGVYRRYPLIARLGEYVFSSLPLAIIHAVLQSYDLQFTVGEGYSGKQKLEEIVVDAFRIPVDSAGAIKVPYKGPFKTFNYVSATDVLAAVADPEALQGKIAIVGTTAAGLYDLRATPVQNVFPGVEIHANIVSGILDQSIKARPAYMLAVEFLEALVLSLLVIFVISLLSVTRMTIALAVMLGAMIFVDYYAWSAMSIDMHSGAPFVVVIWLYIVQMFYGYFFETRKKQHLGKIFGQYIPPKLVEEMVEEDVDAKLSGDSRNMTVLFSDVRGFTSISESLDSQELTQLINEILTPLTKVIYKNRGTIDKYMGDAVMAFWGAPIVMENHAELAVKSALQMIEAIDNAQAAYAKKGWPPIKMGVGLNTGRMSVGNMGSEYRMAYTVMGDAVNLGSRLEGLTKQYGVDIIVSETTREAVPDLIYRELDRVRVKGKLEPITIYEPVVAKKKASDELIYEVSQLNEGLEQYRAQNWKDAKMTFGRLQEFYPDRLLYKMYLERIEAYRHQAPPENWDGVFTFTTK